MNLHVHVHAQPITTMNVNPAVRSLLTAGARAWRWGVPGPFRKGTPHHACFQIACKTSKRLFRGLRSVSRSQLNLLALLPVSDAVDGVDLRTFMEYNPLLALCGPFFGQVMGGIHLTCVRLEEDSVRCWGLNNNGELGVGHTKNVGGDPGDMGSALVPTELFEKEKPGAGLEGLSIGEGSNEGWLLLQHNGSFGLVCDDGFTDATAQVA